jgi:DNA sulfur modification protein DndD
MASIINSISFHNFFNYYGDYDNNRYELEEGVNIIVADNGAGKSKFFNAFLWLFEDKVLDSDDKTKKNIRDVYVKVVSDKAKFETDIQGKVSCGIQLEYTSGDRVKYQIIKSFTGVRLDENITDGNSWQFIPGEIEVNKTDIVLTRYRPVYDEDEKKRIIDKLIAPAFRKYSFLQGEEVNKIIDFSKKASIEEAVQNLTDIKVYEKISAVTSDIKVMAEKDLNKFVKESSDKSDQFDKTIAFKASKENALQQELEKIKQFEETFDNAEKEFNELDKNSANAEKRKDFDDQLASARGKLRNSVDEYEKYLEGINNRFFDGNFSWLAMGFHEHVDNYRRLNENYISKRYEKKALMEVEDNPNDYFHFLPVNSPDTVSLENMIEKEHCYVCDRAAPKGTPSYEYLIKLKNRPTLKKEEKPFVKNDLKDLFGNIQINAQPFYNKIDDIPQSIKTTRLKESQMLAGINKQKTKVKSIDDQRKDVVVAGNENTDPKAIIAAYKGAIRRMENARLKIDNIIKPGIAKLKKDIKVYEIELKSINKNQNIPEGYQLNYEMAMDLEEAAENAAERVYDNMISKLEEHANEHFKKLIANNNLAGGILKFEKSPTGSIQFMYLDSKGNNVSGSSTGFQLMKKFAVVLAIITANDSNYSYPLLADAPLSDFGEGFSESFFTASGDVFPQSIILVKELYNRKDPTKLSDLGKELLNTENINKIYVNEVPEVKPEQIELSTNIICIK